MGEILEFIKMASEGKPYQPNGLLRKPKVINKPCTTNPDNNHIFVNYSYDEGLVIRMGQSD